MAPGDYSHPLRFSRRLHAWYWSLSKEDRKKYRSSRWFVESLTVLAIVASGIAAWILKSPYPLFGVLLTIVVSIIWTKRIRRRFGFKG
jgi:hypothetical protein